MLCDGRGCRNCCIQRDTDSSICIVELQSISCFADLLEEATLVQHSSAIIILWHSSPVESTSLREEKTWFGRRGLGWKYFRIERCASHSQWQNEDRRWQPKHPVIFTKHASLKCLTFQFQFPVTAAGQHSPINSPQLLRLHVSVWPMLSSHTLSKCSEVTVCDLLSAGGKCADKVLDVTFSFPTKSRQKSCEACSNIENPFPGWQLN